MFVDLAPVRDPALVMVEVAQALGVEPRSGTDLTGQLAAALGNEERLVVLDNCEHLLAAAPDVGQVLAACPRLRVLATSRERLRLSAEQEFPVPPLAMPAPADIADLSCLAANPFVLKLVLLRVGSAGLAAPSPWPRFAARLLTARVPGHRAHLQLATPRGLAWRGAARKGLDRLAGQALAAPCSPEQAAAGGGWQKAPPGDLA